MNVYAIGDLHLSFGEGVDKPMDIYGGPWDNYVEKLEKNWKETVKEDDVVIIAGDISWGLKLEETLPDLEWIDKLPGQKVMIKGNHDLWWNGIGKLNALYDSIFFLQNNVYEGDNFSICGTRGWVCPGTDGFDAHNEKIYKREVLRLKNSLEKANTEKPIIAALHYPPTNDKHQGSGFTDLFTEFKVKTVVYGHLHGKDVYPKGLKGIFNGTEYKLVSLDFLECNLEKIL